MSEKYTTHEHETAHESHHKNEVHHQKVERELHKHEIEHGNSEQLETHRAHIEKHAKSVHEHSVGEHEHKSHHPVLVNKQLKEAAFTRSMTRTRKKLSPPSRVFSKVIHNPVIERTSDVVGKTAARPSSMLGGAFFALVGTSLLLWITRHYGYEYNFLAVILLFAIGFVVGISIEGAWRLLKKSE